VHLSVPGNILLLGEYAVLEEGGLGLAMAADRRVRISIDPGDSLTIEGTWQGHALSWSPGAGVSIPLFEAALDAVESWLSSSGAEAGGWRCRISIDSSPFFTAGGRKAGLGSSAAVSLGLVSALLQAAGISPRERDAAAPGLAVQAHRSAQGGRGSGYDVACSLHGGAGIFTGGVEPAWESSRIPGDPDVYLYPGPRAVSTPDAIGRYEAWKLREPRQACEFLDNSNRAILAFVHAGSTKEAARSFGACRRIGIELGEAIGVPARLETPGGLDPAWCKAVGAGSELGAFLLPRGASAPHVEGTPLQLVRQNGGIAWEE
jgi:phosphomevalonate kinase